MYTYKNIRKTIRKNSKNKIANFINSATKITMSTSGYDLYDCWTRGEDFTISAKDVFEFMADEYN